MEHESTNIDLVELKRILECLRDEVSVVQTKLGRIEQGTYKIASIYNQICVKIVTIVDDDDVVVMLVANVRFMVNKTRFPVIRKKKKDFLILCKKFTSKPVVDLYIVECKVYGIIWVEK